MFNSSPSFKSVMYTMVMLLFRPGPSGVSVCLWEINTQAVNIVVRFYFTERTYLKLNGTMNDHANNNIRCTVSVTLCRKMRIKRIYIHFRNIISLLRRIIRIPGFRLFAAVSILNGTYRACFFDVFYKLFQCYVIISFFLTIHLHFYLYIYKIVDKKIVHQPFKCNGLEAFKAGQEKNLWSPPGIGTIY